MPSPHRLAALTSRLHLPRRTVRLRLTVLYGALFLVSGAALLAITYVLVLRSTATPVLFFHNGTVRGGVAPGVGPQVAERIEGPPGAIVRASPAGGTGAASAAGGGSTTGGPLPALPPAQALQLTVQATRQHAAELHQLLMQSGIALAIMAVVSIALGWLISGRVLAPLRTMTVATRRISEDNLHERLALGGPDDELKDLADTIDGLLERLQAAFDAQRRFVANASHELRTPLAMMRTSLDVAVAKPGPAPPRLGVLEDKLREGLDRADRLLESFLMLARAQHGALSDRATVSLEAVLATAIEAHRPALAARGIELRRALGEARVAGSETLLARMVENVIENAVRHNEPGGWMRVETATDGAVARVVVESGGPVLGERAVAQLAQPFRRLGADRTGSDDGVGLGLSIVAAIAAAHGGALVLRALPAGGLRVQIELPRAARAAAAGALPELAGAGAPI
jgi:signal transduction histidine kinase